MGPEKKIKLNNDLGGGKQDNEAVFEIGGSRRVSVSKFNGKVFVNIREYYKDKSTGEEKVRDLCLTIDNVMVGMDGYHIYCTARKERDCSHS